MRRIVALLIVLGFSVLSGHAEAKGDNDFTPFYKYRVWLSDKGGDAYVQRQLNHPERYLSAKALYRRERQGLKVDVTDVPINPRYIKLITNIAGVDLILRSKWNNTVVVSCEDTTLMQSVVALPFVKKVEQVARYDKKNENFDLNRGVTSLPEEQNNKGEALYGVGENQINVINGQPLHKAGFRGEGVLIAVIDGGFCNLDRVNAINQKSIIGTKNFVLPEVSVFDMKDEHGLQVASCMAANEENVMIGTAPNASYWLLVSEDGESEQPIEEDNWAAAIEYADSVGVDVVNTSLGYGGYDSEGGTRVKIPTWERNGRDHLISRSASMAAGKGMVLCNAAGNGGEDILTTIGVPADADNILTVGSVGKIGNSTLSAEEKFPNGEELLFFSSRGGSYDGRIKPDVVCEGFNVVKRSGKTGFSYGTSISSPVLCGMVACLWQALPELTAYEIIDIVKRSATHYRNPNMDYGYGIPDFEKALQLGKELRK